MSGTLTDSSFPLNDVVLVRMRGLYGGGRIMPEHLPPPLEAPAIKQQLTSADAPAMIAALISERADARLKGEQDTADLYEQLLSVVEPALREQALQQSGGQYS